MATQVTALDTTVTAEGVEIQAALANNSTIIQGISDYLKNQANNPNLAADEAAEVAILQQQTAALHASNQSIAAAIASAQTPASGTTGAPVGGSTPGTGTPASANTAGSTSVPSAPTPTVATVPVNTATAPVPLAPPVGTPTGSNQ